MRNLTGQKFGLLTVIEDDGTRDKFGAIMWLCKCDCGAEVHIRSRRLIKGHILTCGWGCGIAHPPVQLYQIGDIVGMAKILDVDILYSKKKGNRTPIYLCECIHCGKKFKITQSCLRIKKSCVCRNKGELCSRWKGGITPLWFALRNSQKYIDWRNNVFKRDTYTCQHCNKAGELNAHHIIPFAKIIHDNNIKFIEDGLICEPLWDVNNGITLCKKCHKKLHKTEGRPKFALSEKGV